jgi:hypothetical protein
MERKDVQTTQKTKRNKLTQKDIDKLYSIFLESIDDEKTLEAIEETIKEYGVKTLLETVFEWVIMEAIPVVNNKLIIPKESDFIPKESD